MFEHASVKPFVKLNCAGHPRVCWGKRAFGHETGEFSQDASRSGLGASKWPMAGTIFWTKIGEVPLELQTKRFAFCQEREFPRAAGELAHASDRLRSLIARRTAIRSKGGEQKFRSDLFRLLNVFSRARTPLRERPGGYSDPGVRISRQQFSSRS